MSRRLGRVRGPDGPCVVAPGAAALQRGAEVSLATVDGATFDDLPALLRAADGAVDRIDVGAPIVVGSDDDVLSVVGAPEKIVCVGLNYRAHAAEGGRADPTHPELFAKWATTLTGPSACIELPLTSSKVDWESEVAFVFGRRCRNVPARDAATVVFGFTAANDVSLRDFQFHASQWTAGKAWDASTPLGPVVVPVGDVGIEPDLELAGRVNGEVVQHARTRDLLFGVPQLVEYITSFMTMNPGDVVLTGTPSGIGAARTPPWFLGVGDVFEVEVEGIGSLRNRFADSGPRPS